MCGEVERQEELTIRRGNALTSTQHRAIQEPARLRAEGALRGRGPGCHRGHTPAASTAPYDTALREQGLGFCPLLYPQTLQTVLTHSSAQ